MKRRRLLHLDGEGLSAWTSRRGRLQALAHFSDDAGGHARFADFLADGRGERYALLVDLPEETLQPIEIPRLGRRDRATLIARRLARQFPDTPLRCAIPLARNAALPGSEKLMLLALAAPWRVAPWLATLAQAGIDLRRLHTASQLAGPLLARFVPNAPTALLVACDRRGFRITALAAGHPRFSRRVANDAPAAAIADEAGRLHRYLLDQRLHAHGRTLPVVVIAPATLLAELAGQWPDEGEFALHPVELAAAAAGVGLAAAAGETDCGAIQLQLLASSPPAAGIRIDSGQRKLATAWFGRLLLAAGGAALAGALGLAAWQLHATGLAGDEARRLDAERVQIDALLTAARREQPALAIDAASLRRLSDIRATIGRLQHQPGAAYLRLSHVLDRQPAIEIERIDWKILPPAASTAEAPRQPIESTTLYGRLREAPAGFAAFVTALRADPSIALSIRQAPGVDAGERDVPLPEFVVELRRSLPR